MISDRYKMIFVHNPKCAGTSIKNMLLSGSDDFTGQEWHYSISELRRKPNPLIEYFTFAFCRNPLDRLASSFTYNINNVLDRKNYHWDAYPKTYPILEKHIKFEIIDSFESFVLSDDFDAIFEARWPVHFKPQHYFLCEQNRIELDFLGRFDSLDVDLDTALKTVNFPRSNKALHLNRSNAIQYEEFYTNQKVRLRVEEKYQADIEILTI
jgi:hypothetical protein